MKSLVVNGHLLPAKLGEMLTSGDWGPSHREFDSRTLPISDKADLALLDFAEMTSNTNFFVEEVRKGDGYLYALGSGSDVDDYLDINTVIVIAATYGQEVLVLDYSIPGSPRVMSTNYPGNRPKWVEVARTFDQLVEILNL
jgi:hypothetical protein